MGLPSPEAIETIVRRTAALRHRLGDEFGPRPLVLPTKEYFPDRFTGDHASVVHLLERMQKHAGMSDVPMEVEVIGSNPEGGASCGCQTTGECNCSSEGRKPGEGACSSEGRKPGEGACSSEGRKPHDRGSSKSCGSGGCATAGCGSTTDVDPSEPRLVDLGESWRLRVAPGELRQPVILTTNIARALGYVFLMETKPASMSLAPPIEHHADLVGCLLGLGGLLLGGSHIYRKSCGGPSILRLTSLEPGELALGTVLFARLANHDPSRLRRELEATQREAFVEAERWCDARGPLLEALRTRPEDVAGGRVSLAAKPTRWWSRLFSRSASTDDESPEALLARLESEMSSPAPQASTAKRARPRDDKDDLADLVAEAFAEPSDSRGRRAGQGEGSEG
jgi:hypothetical protein